MRVDRLLSVIVGSIVLFVAASASAQGPMPYGPPITLAQAKKVMSGAEAEAMKNKWNVVITILDSGGNLVMVQRMDGAQWGSIDVAREKAHSAVAFRRPTKDFQERVEKGGGGLGLLRLPGASPLDGGLPITADGKIIGAIGVSGVTGAQDAQIGRAGVE
ncbi:MAG: GlcG/HbpS family heme-binding protein, partial [Candidatus Rokuibacteriota bacterium]